MKLLINAESKHISYKTILFLMGLTALAVRLIYIYIYPHALVGDEPDYHAAAVGLLQGQELHFGPFRSLWGPLYPLFIAAIYALSGLSTKAVIYAQIILNVINVLMIAKIGERLNGRITGMLSGFVACFYYGLFIRVNQLLPDILFCFLFTGSILYLLKAQQSDQLEYGIWSGILLGLATLAKPVTLIFPLLLLPWALIGLTRSKTKIKLLGIITLIFLFIIVPYTWRNYRIHHCFVPVATEGGITFWGSNNPYANGRWNIGQIDYNASRFMEMPEAERSAAYFREGLKYIKGQSPLSLAKLCLYKIIGTLYPFLPEYDWTFVFLLPFWLLGMGFVFHYNDKNHLMFYPVLLYFIATILFCGYPRMREPISPYTIIFASVAMINVWRKNINQLRWLVFAWICFNLVIYFQSEGIRVFLKSTLHY